MGRDIVGSMAEIVAHRLLTTETVTIRDVYCQGRHAGRSDEESTDETRLVFPYRGVFVRHLGSDQAVAEANQVLLFNHSESYRVSHPVPGGDASLDVVVTYPVLRELTPRALLGKGATPVFRRQRLRIVRADPLLRLSSCDALRLSTRRGGGPEGTIDRWAAASWNQYLK